MPEDQDWVSIGVAAALAREYAEDGRAFVPVFADMLSKALPDETEPIMAGGFLSKKTVVGVRISLGDFRYEVDSSQKGPIKASRTHIVRGISLKSEPMEMSDWLAEVGAAIESHMHGNARAHAALSSLLGL